MTIPHQGIGRGRLVPSSHKGSKFRYTIGRQFSRGDERIREDIPVPDSLGKETFLVGIFTRLDWAKILDNKGQVDTFILDFEKAFDTPPSPHELLKSKLFSYGIGGKTLA